MIPPRTLPWCPPVCIAAALLGYADGDPWLVALLMAATAAISLVAFLYSKESRLTDVGLAEHAPASPGGAEPAAP